MPCKASEESDCAGDIIIEFYLFLPLRLASTPGLPLVTPGFTHHCPQMSVTDILLSGLILIFPDVFYTTIAGLV